MSNKEKMYECEAKRTFIVEGARRRKWMVVPVVDLVDRGDTEFRCKDCRGEVKLFRKRGENGAPPHVVHKLRQDSEYCPAGLYFQEAKDGRVSRWSEFPVQ